MTAAPLEEVGRWLLPPARSGDDYTTEGTQIAYLRSEGLAAIARMPQRTIEGLAAARALPQSRGALAYLLVAALGYAEALISADRGAAGWDPEAALRELDNAILFSDLLEAVAPDRPGSDTWRHRANIMTWALRDVRDAARVVGDLPFCPDRDWLAATAEEQEEARARMVVAMLPGMGGGSPGVLDFIRANLHRADRLIAAALQRGTLDPGALAPTMDAPAPLSEGAL